MIPASQEVFISNEILRESSPVELKALITETQEKLLGLRHQKELCPVKKPHLFKAYKNLIARAKTILREGQWLAAR